MQAYTFKSRERDRGLICMQLAGDIISWVNDNAPVGNVWVEAPVVAGARNLQSTIKVAQVTGLVHALVPNTHQVAVSSWKKSTVGKGNADKQSVREWLAREYPDLYAACTSQDHVDAACIALHGRTMDSGR